MRFEILKNCSLFFEVRKTNIAKSLGERKPKLTIKNIFFTVHFFKKLVYSASQMWFSEDFIYGNVYSLGFWLKLLGFSPVFTGKYFWVQLMRHFS